MKMCHFAITSAFKKHFTETLTPSFTARITDDVAQLHFLNMPKSNDIFADIAYFQTLENAAPTNHTTKGGAKMRQLFVIIEQDKTPIAFLPCQVAIFDAAASLQFSEQKVIRFAQKKLASMLQFRTLVVGNLLLTGTHIVLPQTDDCVLQFGISAALKHLKAQNIPAQAIFVKDFSAEKADKLNLPFFNRYTVEPNFKLNIREDWKTYDDYLQALGAKYRTRAKRAVKLLGAVEKKEFSLAEIVENQDIINKMYRDVCENARFNLLTLNDNYFAEMKQNLGEKFRMTAYTEGGQILGFYTTVQNTDSLEAHFLGFDVSQNQARQLYLNMLFDIIAQGIQFGKKQIIFGRTAHEIKSSVGAEAEETFLFFKHKNLIINTLFMPIFNFLYQKEEWQPRSPFK